MGSTGPEGRRTCWGVRCRARPYAAGAWTQTSQKERKKGTCTPSPFHRFLTFKARGQLIPEKSAQPFLEKNHQTFFKMAARDMPKHARTNTYTLAYAHVGKKEVVELCFRVCFRVFFRIRFRKLPRKLPEKFFHCVFNGKTFRKVFGEVFGSKLGRQLGSKLGRELGNETSGFVATRHYETARRC